ncbi:alpha/beta fold hydrolase [Demequina oxidasica]|uniref:alpha/beta fold hydrolase n=1 Tax=Demequina oxidasica TaxID=676199 RepID=UPI0007852998|nr:alpha/beta hydrolase [Demequina oxidasica]
MFTTHTIEGPDGRTLQYYVAKNDTADDAVAGSAIPLIWLHGSPNVGEPPLPLYDAAAGHGIGWIGYDRPGYGGSGENVGRDIASAARDVEAVADDLGLGRFAVMGHSGGGAHALACAALLPERVGAAVAIAGLAPSTDEGPERADKLRIVKGLRSDDAAARDVAMTGRAGLIEGDGEDEFDMNAFFTPEDQAALAGEWDWFNHVVKLGNKNGNGPFVDDELAAASDWGFDVGDIRVPTLIMHGVDDRLVPVSNARWLGAHVPGSQLWLGAGAGHITVMDRSADALAWVAQTMAAR